MYVVKVKRKEQGEDEIENVPRKRGVIYLDLGQLDRSPVGQVPGVGNEGLAIADEASP
jgi:hypothetical protein